MSDTKDLVVLTADKDAKLGIETLLCRADALRIRPVTFECYAHPQHDGGVVVRGHEFLRPFIRSFSHALALFDLEGCGQESLSREAVEVKVHANLTVNGWQGRCAAIAIAPELEQWVWDGTLQIARMLGWGKQRLREWLLQNEFLKPDGEIKPQRPKDTFREAMRAARLQLSSSVFQDLARSANVAGCTDAAFRKLLATLQAWFPASGQQ